MGPSRVTGYPDIGLEFLNWAVQLAGSPLGEACHRATVGIVISSKPFRANVRIADQLGAIARLRLSGHAEDGNEV